MPTPTAEDPELGKLRQLLGYLEDIEKAIEPAYVVAGEVRDKLFDASTSDEDVMEVVVDQVFGRLGACADLVAMARGELAGALGMSSG